MEVLVEFEYDALHDDELTLRPGDIIKNVRHTDDEGWMEGELNGRRGVFPDNFVKELKKDPKEVKEVKNEPKQEASQPQGRERSNVANLAKRISFINPTGGFQPIPPAASKKPKKRQCKVLFDYKPENEDELELKVGDVVEIIEEVEEGWWNGSFNGKSGLFPSNFVQELEAAGEEAETSDTPADKTDGSGAETLAGVPPTSPQPDSGNGATQQPKKVQGVGFGDIFKDGSVKLRPRFSPVAEDRKSKDQEKDNAGPAKPVSSLPSAAKPAHPNMTDYQRADVDGKPKGSTAKESCKVKFAYEGKNEDELTLKEGEMVHILNKRGKRPPPLKTPDKPTPMPKPGKPPAPIPPKKPDKPAVPSLTHKQNGEVPSTRPKSDFEPLLPTKPKTQSVDFGEKPSDTGDLIGFDDLPATKPLISVTADRPKRKDRRPPGQYVKGQSPTKEGGAEKSFKFDEEESAKPKPTEHKKPQPSNHSPLLHRASESKASSASALDTGVSHNSKVQLEPEEQSAQQEEIKSQIKDLLLSVERLKAEQMKEITELRRDLDEERLKRVALQMEVEKLKRAFHST
ncbi:CD2-associated protein isoform X8 [Fundulus heteroclitus]|uniref:CD2-associated protein isoform X8 n=1 Tax=Fundulus heteroclitus TaxID=8078 RepID=UPI00165A95CB|nr:CD2-associated protein isoform X8 [Fundulus heteroclitus]